MNHVPPTPAEAARSSQPTLLVVDDQPTNLQLLFGMLSSDYRLLAASNAEAALSLAAEQQPDLVLMDVMLPGMSGLEACRRLKRQIETRDIPVIFMTGGNTPDEESACWEAGGVDFIPKPLNAMTVQRRIAVHVRLKQQADQLRLLASTDALTGIANRREFDAELQAEWRRCWDQGAPLSLAMVDVDWFKGYNDHYGHQQGDEALRAVAATLAASFNRHGDVVARVGGEEFAVLLPNTSEANSLLLLERLCAALRVKAIDHAGSPLGQLSVSVGVATVEPGPGVSPAALVECADQRLYQAKADGRNRIIGSAQASAG